jgi:succinate-semialdehyde dehydrogenase/glutarate-semialdehyde dehydrogenase
MWSARTPGSGIRHQRAALLAGGCSVPREGFFFQPTVLADVAPGMAAFDEETFGPVAAIAVATDDDYGVALASATPYDLGRGVWSGDRSHAPDVARGITSGAAFVNAMMASDARVPFGGTKRSGHGRELADVGFKEFVNMRTYWAV